MTFQLRLELSIERRVDRWFNTLSDDDVCFWCRLDYCRQVATVLQLILQAHKPQTISQWVKFRHTHLDDITLQRTLRYVVGDGCSPADHYDPDQVRDGRRSDRG